MAETKSGEPFMHKVAAFIVDKRNIILVLYIAAFLFSLAMQDRVNVCDDLTAYLPSDTETRQGLTIMEDEFVTYATSRVMVANITYAEAESLCAGIEALPQVEAIDFADDEAHYKAASALFEITMKGEAGDAVVAEGYAAIRDLLTGYDTYIQESDVDSSASLAEEVSLILAIAAVIIVAVLLLTSQTYMEVPVLLITFVVGIVLNKGTNFIFDEISFVSNSVTAVLQLALSIDYAIIMIHHYSEQRQSCAQREAVINALERSIVEISGSSLTTISGLMALMFMQFKIGFDMGICLIKSIFFSLLCVFTLMPCLLMLFGKYIDRTHHKSLLPDISRLGNFVYKLRYVVPPLFAVLLVGAFFLSSNCLYTYNAGSSETSRKNETQIAKEMIESQFGAKNFAALVIPSGDYAREQALVNELLACDEVESVTALPNIEAKDGYMLTDKLTPRMFSEMTDLDIDTVRLLYTVYAAENEDYSKLITSMSDYGVPIIDMFMFIYDLKDDGYVELDGELGEEIDDLYTQLTMAKDQLSGAQYSRMLIYMDLPIEGEETFAFIDKVHAIADRYYDTYYFVGDSTSCYDLAASFATDNIVVSVLSALFVILILFFTFKNAGLPVLLILVIQGSVWMNFSMSAITGASIFFLSYLIISSIQMGANIDYAIVISNRYMELKKETDIKSAMCGALNFAFPTVLTSGSILAAAGFLIGKLSTDAAIVSIGTALCRGTLISMFLVMLVLPEILLLGDSIVEKTGVSIKRPEVIRRETGNFVLNGHVRGRIEGFIDADVNGVFSGNLQAAVKIDNIGNKKGDDEDENAGEDSLE